MSTKVKIFSPLRAAYSGTVPAYEAALRLTDCLVGVASIVSCLENLTALARSRSQPGLLASPLSRYRKAPSSLKPRRSAADALPRGSACGLEALRLTASAVLLSPTSARGTRACALGFLASSSALTYRHHTVQSDGSEQLLFHVQAASALARLVGSPRTAQTCLWYIALQSTLAYSVAGYAKIAGPHWRSGRALGEVLRTESYGSRRAFQLVRTHPRAARGVGIAVIAGECSFPLLYLGRGRLAPAFVLTAGAFHVVNAGVMGLGRFFWAFASTYPALLYTARLARRGHSRAQ